MVLNYCGRGHSPGTTGREGEIGGANPPRLVPRFVDPSSPFVPSLPKPVPPFEPLTPRIPTGPSTGGPGAPKWKCVTLPESPGSPPPGEEFVNPNQRQVCLPCDGAINPNIGGANPDPTDPECTYASKAACIASPCADETRLIPGLGGITGGFGQSGPTTGGTQKYKCVPTYVQQCIETANTPFTWENYSVGIVTASNLVAGCVACNDTYVNAAGVVVPDPHCIHNSIAECQTGCVSPQILGQCIDPVAPTISVYLDPNTAAPLPSFTPSVVTGSNQNTVGLEQEPTVTAALEQSVIEGLNIPTPPNNIGIVSVDEIVMEDDFSEISQGRLRPKLYDPELNFFTMEPSPTSEMTGQSSESNVFQPSVAKEIAELLVRAESSQESRSPSAQEWNELDLQSITDDRLMASLNPRLLSAFQSLRYYGGEKVGLSTFLGVIRRHLFEGTIDEVDTNFYINTYEGQKWNEVTLFDNSEYKEYSERFVIKFLINKDYTYENTTKDTAFGNTQIGRMRPLNEDLNMSLNIEKLDSTVLKLDVPNEGISVSTVTPSSQVTPPSVGSPDRLNIGDGWGFYLHSNQLNGDGVAVPTNNIIETAYYAPPAAREKALGLLGVDTSIRITAESLSNNNEFVAGDAGPSALEALYFGIDLSSVVGEPTESNPLIEQYSSVYSRISASADIATHLNNNALNVPMFAIDYRDPLYRYILDTSSFTAVQKDFTMAGFRDKSVSGIDAKFVRNIPFGFVVTPVVGSKYNPFNGKSTLDSFGSINKRSISIEAPPPEVVDGVESPIYNSYNLYNKDGSTRIGLMEAEDYQNFGYTYDPGQFSDTFFSSGVYGSSLQVASSYGASYLTKDVLDYIYDSYSSTAITWYDVFSRMPINRVGELFYEGVHAYLNSLSKGYRNSTTIDNVEVSPLNSDRILPEDSKTVVKRTNRLNVTTFDL